MWWRKTAEQGMTEALFDQGLISLSNQERAPQARVEAYKWFTLAADQGAAEWLKPTDALSKALTPEQIAEANDAPQHFCPRLRHPINRRDEATRKKSKIVWPPRFVARRVV